MTPKRFLNDEARKAYEDARRLYQAEQDRLGEANVLRGLGDLERALKRIDIARKYYRDAAIHYGLAGLTQQQRAMNDLAVLLDTELTTGPQPLPDPKRRGVDRLPTRPETHPPSELAPESDSKYDVQDSRRLRKINLELQRSGPGDHQLLSPLTTIRVFLASSSELKEDRDAFDLYFRQQNDQFLKKGLYLTVDRWENFLDAMSETRLQDEYNKQVRACDIFVSLFFTKTGKFTEEEFDTAHRQFKETRRPRIYTFFKNANVSMGTITDEIVSLLNFKKKLGDLGHFYTSYDNIEHLKRQFRDQLDKLIAEDE